MPNVYPQIVKLGGVVVCRACRREPIKQRVEVGLRDGRLGAETNPLTNDREPDGKLWVQRVFAIEVLEGVEELLGSPLGKSHCFAYSTRNINAFGNECPPPTPGRSRLRRRPARRARAETPPSLARLLARHRRRSSRHGAAGARPRSSCAATTARAGARCSSPAASSTR